MKEYCCDYLDLDVLSELQSAGIPLHLWIHECTPKYWTFYFCIQYAPEYCLVFYADTELGSGWEEIVFLRSEKQKMVWNGSHYIPPRESFPHDAQLSADWSFLCTVDPPLRMEIVHDTVVFRKDYSDGSPAEEWQISANIGLVIYSNDRKWILMTADCSPRMIYLTEFSEVESIRETWRFHYDLPEHRSTDDPYTIDLVSAKRDFLPL